VSTLLSGGADVPEKQVGDAGDAVPPAPAEAKPTVSAAAENLEGAAPAPKDKGAGSSGAGSSGAGSSGAGNSGAGNSGVAGDGDATGDAVNGDNS
jgi:hypothetical protein